jgi:hypothetical protein
MDLDSGSPPAFAGVARNDILNAMSNKNPIRFLKTQTLFGYARQGIQPTRYLLKRIDKARPWQREAMENLAVSQVFASPFFDKAPPHGCNRKSRFHGG